MGKLLPQVVLTFQEGKTITFTSCTFREVVIRMFRDHLWDESWPIKLEIPFYNMVHYCSRKAFQRYYDEDDEDFNNEDFYAATYCHALVRNKETVRTEDRGEIDKGALWLRTGDEVTLADDDQHIRCAYDPNLFEEI